MNRAELQKLVEWLKHTDLQDFLGCDDVRSPWFPAYCYTKSADREQIWFAALVPPGSIPELITHSSRWDFFVGDGSPTILTTCAGGQEQHSIRSLRQ
jgi:hypothetical protein